ncbi:BlaI/MecI/CopY family transcriptional regulator [Candidatus Pacearchaeota archaeon]|nr:BlaI/MecI/CopY family transcriptional regulator [Candidatus Pacearchaeota archaeon]
MVKHYLFTDDIIKSLSPLESFIIKSLKPNKKYSSQTVYNLVNKNKKVSRSSIPVILDRLYKKGILTRETETARGGIRFIYRLQLNIEKFERSVVENTVNSLIKRFGEKAIVYFNESVTKQKRK